MLLFLVFIKNKISSYTFLDLAIAGYVCMMAVGSSSKCAVHTVNQKNVNEQNI